MGDSDKQMVSFRVSKDTKDQIEEYADEQGISQSEAFRRLVRKGNELEKSGITISIDKNSSESLITDGGAVRKEIQEGNSEIEQELEQMRKERDRSMRITLFMGGLITAGFGLMFLVPGSQVVVSTGLILMGIAMLGGFLMEMKYE